MVAVEVQIGRMKSEAVILMAAWLTAGCTTVGLQYDKAGVTEADRQRDLMECVQASITGGGVRRGFALFRVDRGAYQQCLTDRGYTVRPTT